MANTQTVREYYEHEGAVRRRVTKDLGGGQRVTVSDTLEHPDIQVFMQEQPDARIRGYHPETEQTFPSPENFTLDELPNFLSGVESVDVLLKMRAMDTRKMAPPIYEERLESILDGAMSDEEQEDVEVDVEAIED